MQCYKNSFGSKINATELYLGFFFFFKDLQAALCFVCFEYYIASPPNKKNQKQKKNKTPEGFLASS